MTRRSLAYVFACLIALALAPAVAVGQRATLTGTVRDSTGVPIPNVEVMVSEERARSVTDSLGRYRLPNLPRREVAVRFRRIGFAAQVRDVDLYRGDVRLDVVMEQTAFTLPPQVVAAARGGLSGVVGDTSFLAVADAEVRLMGYGQEAKTDASGAFSFDVPAGQYQVRVRRMNYGQKLFSVTVPKDSGRHVTVWLIPFDSTLPKAFLAKMGGFDQSQELRMLALRRRAQSRSRSNYFTREDLDKSGAEWLYDLVGRLGVSAPQPQDICVVMNGGPRVTYSDMVSVAEVDAVEIYPPGSLRGISVLDYAEESIVGGSRRLVGGRADDGGAPRRGSGGAARDFGNYHTATCSDWRMYAWTR